MTTITKSGRLKNLYGCKPSEFYLIGKILTLDCETICIHRVIPRTIKK